MKEEDDQEIAYYIPHKYEHLTLKLKKSANAWWLDATKVIQLLDAFDFHNATIEEACYVVGISIKQYKYFASLHPVIHERRKIARYEMEHEKAKGIVSMVNAGDPKACMRWLSYTEPEFFDLRYRSPLARLRRLYGLPAHLPPPKTEEEKLEDMKRAVEKTRQEILSGKYTKRKNYLR